VRHMLGPAFTIAFLTLVTGKNPETSPSRSHGQPSGRQRPYSTRHISPELADLRATVAGVLQELAISRILRVAFEAEDEQWNVPAWIFNLVPGTSPGAGPSCQPLLLGSRSRLFHLIFHSAQLAIAHVHAYTVLSSQYSAAVVDGDDVAEVDGRSASITISLRWPMFKPRKAPLELQLWLR